jgi:hypothetical protein
MRIRKLKVVSELNGTLQMRRIFGVDVNRTQKSVSIFATS